MASLEGRLRELQQKYQRLSEQKMLTSNSLEAWPRVAAEEDLWDSLYSPYVQWVQWKYVIPSNDDMMQLVHFNLAVSIHKALADVAEYKSALPEPVLEWLPTLLCGKDAGVPCDTSQQPLWPRERLQAYIQTLPRQELLQKHAIPKGLVGVVRGVPRVPPLELSDLVQGQGWAPAPDVTNYQKTAAMVVAGAPLDLDALFGTM